MAKSIHQGFLRQVRWCLYHDLRAVDVIPCLVNPSDPTAKRLLASSQGQVMKADPFATTEWVPILASEFAFELGLYLAFSRELSRSPKVSY
jgi:hypothetical protein